MKSVRIRSYSGPHFTHLNWTRTRITPNWDTFYAVPVECEYLFFCKITEIEFQNSLLSTLTKEHVQIIASQKKQKEKQKKLQNLKRT